MKFSALRLPYKKLGIFLFPFATILIALALYLLQPGFAQRAWCNIIVPMQNPALTREYFFDCSNVRQQIISMENIVDQPSDDPRWRFFTPKDPSKPGKLLIWIKKDRNKVILYPRMSGPLDVVTIHEMRNHQRRMLFFVEGSEGRWSPISKQYVLNLCCVDFGWIDEEFDVKLTINIYGFGQIWHKDENIFY